MSKILSVGRAVALLSATMIIAPGAADARPGLAAHAPAAVIFRAGRLLCYYPIGWHGPGYYPCRRPHFAKSARFPHAARTHRVAIPHVRSRGGRIRVPHLRPRHGGHHHPGDGHGMNGHGMNGHGMNGHGMNGHGMNGHGMNGHGMNGHGMNGHAAAGMAGGGRVILHPSRAGSFGRVPLRGAPMGIDNAPVRGSFAHGGGYPREGAPMGGTPVGGGVRVGTPASAPTRSAMPMGAPRGSAPMGGGMHMGAPMGGAPAGGMHVGAPMGGASMGGGMHMGAPAAAPAMHAPAAAAPAAHAPAAPPAAAHH